MHLPERLAFLEGQLDPQRDDNRRIERRGIPAAQGRDELEIRLDHQATGKLDAMEALEHASCPPDPVEPEPV
jgi:hypothetical protein